MTADAATTLGLRANRWQFGWLVLTNAFVGGLVGMERALLPLLAENVYGVHTYTAILGFLVTFGLAKALANYQAGRWGERVGRLRVLRASWWFALPVPLLLYWAPSWEWVLVANLLLGVQQGLSWSTLVVMKTDLVKPEERGLAMGLNEFAGYAAVGLAAWLTGLLAVTYDIQTVLAVAGTALVLAGLAMSWLVVADTHGHAQAAARQSLLERTQHLWKELGWRNRLLAGVTQAGFVNNLNDGMVWGLLPLLMLRSHYSAAETGWVAGLYPLVWGVTQLGTGWLADRISRKLMVVGGMVMQGVALGLWLEPGWEALIGGAVLLGLGTALVYPTFLSLIGGVVHPADRSRTMGAFRLVRDLGYVGGALLAGLTADWLGLTGAVGLTAGLTVLSGVVALVVLPRATAVPVRCVSAEDAQAASEGGRGQLLDVRTLVEQAESPVLAAQSVPLAELTMFDWEGYQGPPLLVLCQKGGGRSVQAAEWLQQQGIPARWVCGGAEAYRALG